MIRRDALMLLLAGAAWPRVAFAATDTSPARIGKMAVGEWLSRPDFMIYEVEPDGGIDVYALHYAEVATAYGALRLTNVTGDHEMGARIRERYDRFIAAKLRNTLNHVDANVVGVWPLEQWEQGRGTAADKALGLAMADGQWAQTTPDGLTKQARYWIDDIWMIGALQIQAWRVSRDPKYLDRAALMARLYVAKLQQPNGLFHHGPNAPFFWGRGNGWVAAGLAEILSGLPRSHPDHAFILAGYRKMMAALLNYQAKDGMWRQLIDHPEAWKETSGTAMFGYAFAMGVAHALLPERRYAAATRRAWQALATYVEPDGKLSKVCIGTGKSDDAAYYLGRPTVTGDLHGQAALLWFASMMVKPG